MSFIGISPSKNATFNFDGRSAVINPSSSTSGLHYGRSVEVSAIPGMSSTTGLAQQTNLSQSYTVHGAHQSSTYNSPAHHFPASDLVCSAKLSYILFSDNYMFCLGKSPRAGEWHYERPTRFTIYPLPEGYLCPARLRGRDTPSRAFNRGIRPRSCSGLCDAQRKLHARTTTRRKRYPGYPPWFSVYPLSAQYPSSSNECINGPKRLRCRHRRLYFQYGSIIPNPCVAIDACHEPGNSRFILWEPKFNCAHVGDS